MEFRVRSNSFRPLTCQLPPRHEQVQYKLVSPQPMKAGVQASRPRWSLLWSNLPSWVVGKLTSLCWLGSECL